MQEPFAWSSRVHTKAKVLATPRCRAQSFWPQSLVIAAIGTVGLLSACASSPTPTPTRPPLPYDAPSLLGESLSTNSCAFVLSPTPTPVDPTATPTPTPTPTPPFTPPPPSLRPTSTPRPVVPLPHVVEAWQDAVVAVRVESDRGRATEQMGLVVGPEGRVLTVMRFTAEVGAITVDVPGGGSFAGEMERVDPRTGATLLRIAASGLVAAPAPEPSLLTAQRVLFIDRDRTTREIMVTGSIASPSVNDADKVFALPPGHAPTPRLGTLVTDTEGVPLGLAGVQRAWWGVQVCLPQGLHPARRSRPCCSRLPSCC